MENTKPVINHDPNKAFNVSSRHPMRLDLTLFGANKEAIADALRELAMEFDLDNVGNHSISAGVSYSYVLKLSESK